MVPRKKAGNRRKMRYVFSVCSCCYNVLLFGCRCFIGQAERGETNESEGKDS